MEKKKKGIRKLVQKKKTGNNDVTKISGRKNKTGVLKIL